MIMKQIVTILLVYVFELSCLGQTHTATDSYLNSSGKSNEPSNFTSRFNDVRNNRGYSSKLFSGNRFFISGNNIQKLDSLINWVYTGNTGQSYMSQKQSFYYDERGNDTLDNTQFRDTTNNEWMDFQKQKKYYDIENNLIRVVYATYYADSNEWKNLSIDSIFYDANGNDTLFLSTDISPSTGLLSSKVKFVSLLNRNGKDSLINYYSWTPEKNEYLITGCSQLLYDRSGNDSLEIRFDLNSDGSIIRVNSQIESSFNGNGNLTMRVQYVWEADSNKLQVYWTHKYAYDQNANLILERGTLQLYGGIWGYYQYKYSYNNLYTTKDFIMPILFRFGAKNLPVSVLTIDSTSGVWADRYNQVYFFSPMVESVVFKKSTPKVCIYPSPASEFVYFKWEDNYETLILKIYNVNGEQVLNGLVSNQNSISVNRILPGLYYYELVHRNKTIYTGEIAIK